MKKGFTLLELIFSMVIIAIAFSVLPKILMMATKVSTQSVREEAMFSAVALAGFIHATPWDEQNTQVDDILHVSAGDSDYDCSSSSYLRVGGFVGSRNCKNNKNASSLGSDSNDGSAYDDVDDFGDTTSSNLNDSRQYTLKVDIDYVDDININDGSSFSTTTSSSSTNTKYIKIQVQPQTKAKELRSNVATFDFYSLNIGQLQVNKRVWQ